VFFIGLAYGVGEIAAFVTLSEFIDKEHRNVYLGLMNISWGIAAFGMAYLYSIYEDWTVLMKAMLIVSILALLPIFFVQESPHFLVSVKGNHTKARKVLDIVASVNKKDPIAGRLEGESRVRQPGAAAPGESGSRPRLPSDIAAPGESSGNRPRLESVGNTIVTTESILNIRA